MINIDGIEYRTAAQWEKKHRHVLKGQLKKGVERSWRSPNGNETMLFYSIEQTRPWAKKDVEAVNRRRRAAAKPQRHADERAHSEKRWELARKKQNDSGEVHSVHMDSCEDRLENLKVLYDAGILDREEYAQRVARVKKAHAQSRG